MGARLALNKVETLVNPFGTVFQPLALAQLLRAATGEEVDWQQHVVEARGRWQSYDLHGSIGAATPVELLQTIQQLVQRTADFVRQTDLVVLTLGTAWAYRLRETGELVSNCHKMPAELFVKELLTPDEIINALAETHAYLRRINPDVEIVLTVSPVRHLKDTLPLNAVSKSVLRVACHYLSDLLAGVSYFPAYELLTDDLRDYRFYAADMLHPSEVAEDYIWDKFARTYFDVDFGRFRKEWAAIRQSLGHRPLHEGAPEHRQFLENTLERLQRLASQGVAVEAELRELEQRLAALPVPPPPAPEPEPEDDGEERIDIGAPDGESTPTSPTPGRPERLSPEEFRRQRSERDRRGRDERRPEPRPNTQPAPVEAAEALAPAAAEAGEEHSEEFASATEVLGLTSATAAVSTGEAEPEQEQQPKKKKRRSRGGAKRTARKHAARLAAEAENALSPAPQGVAPSDASASEEQAPQQATTPSAPTAVAAAAVEIPASEAPAVVLPEVPAVAPPAIAEPARREAGRQGKKSTVITKSTPVKRGSRRGVQPPAVEAPPAPLPLAGETALPELPEVVAISAPVVPELPIPALTVGEETVVTAKSNKGRNRGSRSKASAERTATPVPAPAEQAPAIVEPVAPQLPEPAAVAEPKPRPKGKGPKRHALYATPAADIVPTEPVAELPTPAAEQTAAPVRKRNPKAAAVAQPAAEVAPAEAGTAPAAAPKPRRAPTKKTPPVVAPAPAEPGQPKEAAPKPKRRAPKKP